jgi:colicin import membrane protein
MKRDELTNRIWRTVVFSGAMLGAPLASADKTEGKPKPPNAEVKPKQAPETVESVSKQVAENSKQVNAAIDAVVAAKTEAERKAAKDKLAALQIEQAKLEAKLVKLKTPAANPELAKLEKQLQEADAKVLVAVDAVAKAKSDAERTAAKSKLDATRKERDAVAAKLKDEQAKQARPRATKEDRPLGRGFILS